MLLLLEVESEFQDAGREVSRSEREVCGSRGSYVVGEVQKVTCLRRVHLPRPAVTVTQAGVALSCRARYTLCSEFSAHEWLVVFTDERGLYEEFAAGLTESRPPIHIYFLHS